MAEVVKPFVIELTDNCEIFDAGCLIDHSFDDLFSKHDHLVLVLNDEIFEGDVVGTLKDKIELCNVRQDGNPNKLSGIYFFYKHEMVEIRRTNKYIPPPILEDTNNTTKLRISEEEYYRHKEMSRDFTYVHHCGSEYKLIISKLKAFQTLGIVALGVEEERSQGIGLLVISTWKAVYLFDMTTLKGNTFYPEIGEILSNENVCKIFHRGGPQIDILRKIYKVTVKNVSDTEILDMVIEKNKSETTSLKKTNNVSECLVKYFNYPSTCLKEALNTRNFKWFKRPLSDRRKLFASELGTYLILLKEKMEERMFSEIQTSIYNICDYYSGLTNYEYAVNYQLREVSEDVKKLIPVLSRHGIDPDDKNKQKSFIKDISEDVSKDMEDLELKKTIKFLKTCERRINKEKLKQRKNNEKTEELHHRSRKKHEEIEWYW